MPNGRLGRRVQYDIVGKISAVVHLDCCLELSRKDESRPSRGRIDVVTARGKKIGVRRQAGSVTEQSPLLDSGPDAEALVLTCVVDSGVQDEVRPRLSIGRVGVHAGL